MSVGGFVEGAWVGTLGFDLHSLTDLRTATDYASAGHFYFYSHPIIVRCLHASVIRNSQGFRLVHFLSNDWVKIFLCHVQKLSQIFYLECLKLNS